MKIVIKVYEGQESPVEVSAESSILELKQLLSNTLGVPVDNQKILFSGKTLTDGQKLNDCCVSDGSTVHLIVKKEGETETTVLRDSAYRFLRQYYNESDSRKIVDEYMKMFYQSISTLSLDDLERIATSFFQDEQKL